MDSSPNLDIFGIPIKSKRQNGYWHINYRWWLWVSLGSQSLAVGRSQRCQTANNVTYETVMYMNALTATAMTATEKRRESDTDTSRDEEPVCLSLDYHWFDQRQGQYQWYCSSCLSVWLWCPWLGSWCVPQVLTTVDQAVQKYNREIW